MQTARVFRSGNSQTVRLPKAFHFKGKEVEIFRRGEEVVLREKTKTTKTSTKEKNLARAFELIAGLPSDLDIPDRHKDFPQHRKGL